VYLSLDDVAGGEQSLAAREPALGIHLGDRVSVDVRITRRYLMRLRRGLTAAYAYPEGTMIFRLRSTLRHTVPAALPATIALTTGVIAGALLFPSRRQRLVLTTALGSSLLIALATALPALSADINYSNGAGDGNWFVPGNWVGGAIPTTNDRAFLTSSTAGQTAFIGAPGAVGSRLTLQGDANLTVGANGTLTLVPIGSLGQGDGALIVGQIEGLNSPTTNSTLTIESGGVVNAARFFIGDGAPNTAQAGVAIVTGAGSTLTIDNGVNYRFMVGATGTTSLLRIDSGGVVNAGSTGNGVVEVGNASYGGSATLQIGNGGTSGTLNASEVQLINASRLVFDHSDNTTFAPVVTGSGTLAKQGSGTLTLNAANSYSGGTTIRGGVLSVSADANLGAASGGLTINGGTLAATASFATNRAVTLAGASGIDVAAPAQLELAGIVSGSGSLEKFGTGTLVLTGTNTYAGGTTTFGGVLQVGNGGTSGSITGNVVNYRTLAFDRSDDIAFAGTISGSGDVQKDGAGSLTLAGVNSYSGGTVIRAGTLIGSATSFGSGQIQNNASLVIDQPGDATFANEINGSGDVTKRGAGTLTLTGANAYTGGTTILAGTLVGSVTSFGSGGITNNAALAIDQAVNASFANAIDGSGSFTKRGAGTLTLAGTNSYTGGTTITDGTLVGSAASFGSGAITNDAALVIDQPVNAAFANAISGAGTFTKRGAGILTLTGTSTLGGQTTVEAGRLSVNGSLASSAVTVASGATLAGSGTVGATLVQSGATIAPGNSIGTLTVNGNLVLAPGSTYAVEIAGSGASDRIAVSSLATITGSQVGVSALDPQTSYTSGQRYTILTATGGISGSASAVSRSAFLDLSVDQQANQVDLVIQVKGTPPVTPPVVPPAVFQSVAQTPNQFSTALALNTLPQAGGTLALYNSLLMLDAPSAPAAFDQLSGEVHASVKTALVEESWLLRSAMNDRLRSAFGAVGATPMGTLSYGFAADLAPRIKGPMPALPSPERFAVWGQGYGSWGRTDGDGNAAKLTRSTGGLLVGADAAVFDTLRFGLLAGYSRSEFDVKGRLSSGESDNYHLGLYGGGQLGAIGLRAGASYTWHDVSTRRTVAFAGFGDGLQSDYNAGTAQVFGELGYRVDLGKMAFEPFAGLAYVNLHTDGFREIGGAAALSARGDDTSVSYSTLGLRASTSLAVQGMALTLRGALAWRHAFGDVDPMATLAFSGSNAFTVAGLPIARDTALVEAGLDLAIGRSATLGVSYNGQLADDAQDHAFKGVLAVRF